MERCCLFCNRLFFRKQIIIILEKYYLGFFGEKVEMGLKILKEKGFRLIKRELVGRFE
jgi:hypothetical protein